MEETITTQKDYREILGTSFKIAAAGAAVCLISACIDIYAAVKEVDSLDSITTWLTIIGLSICGGALVNAGNKVCNLGHKETGVVSTGGALIFYGLILLIERLFVKEESLIDGTMSYIWAGLEVLGPAIAYFALKQEKDKEDKYFDTLGMGMGAVAIAIILTFAAIKLALYASHGGGLSVHSSGYYVSYEYNRSASIGMWVLTHFKLVSIILTSLTALGMLLTFGSICTYSDFIKDIKADEDEAKKQEEIAEMAADYKKLKEEKEALEAEKQKTIEAVNDKLPHKE